MPQHMQIGQGVELAFCEPAATRYDAHTKDEGHLCLKFAQNPSRLFVLLAQRGCHNNGLAGKAAIEEVLHMPHERCNHGCSHKASVRRPS